MISASLIFPDKPWKANIYLYMFFILISVFSRKCNTPWRFHGCSNNKSFSVISVDYSCCKHRLMLYTASLPAVKCHKELYAVSITFQTVHPFILWFALEQMKEQSIWLLWAVQTISFRDFYKRDWLYQCLLHILSKDVPLWRCLKVTMLVNHKKNISNKNIFIYGIYCI